MLAIANLVLDTKVKNTLETGMAYGASTLAFLAAKINADMDDGMHIAIDPFQRAHYDDCAVIAVRNADLDRIF